MKIYDAGREEEKAAWLQAWTEWEAREPHAHPAYAQAFLKPGERALCAVGEGVLMPMIVRPLPSSPDSEGVTEDSAGSKTPGNQALPDPTPEGSHSGACDLVTPYGYGGPFQTSPGDADRLWDDLERWAAERGAISLFARLPLVSPAPFRGETIDLMPNVVVDLAQPDRWMGYDGKVRRNVKKAQAAGIEIVEDPRGERLDDFMRVYALTMDRRGATDGYRFDEAFYRKLLDEMPDGATFFHAVKDGRVVSSEFVLHGPESAYFFLGGTDTDFYADRPNDLLKHAIMDALAERGLKRYVLGGGYGEDDGILRYKRSFAPKGVVPYRVGRRTFDPSASDVLVQMRRAQEAGWSPREGFFPPYRAPGFSLVVEGGLVPAPMVDERPVPCA